MYIHTFESLAMYNTRKVIPELKSLPPKRKEENTGKSQVRIGTVHIKKLHSHKK